jgi:hypothetical protein
MTVIDREQEWVIAAAGRHTSMAGTRATARLRGWWARPACREFAMIAAVYGLYGMTRRLTLGGTLVADGNARRVLRVEHLAGLAPERWLNRVVSARAYLAVPADYAYATLHYIVTPVVLVWLWRAHRAAYLPARRTLTAATVLGLIGFATVPLAPPRMRPGFIDTMSRYGSDGWWGSAASAPRGLGSLTNQFAAMPSLHVGWAIWCGWMVARHSRRPWIRSLAVSYPVLVVVVVLGTGNHFLADAVAGAAVLLAGWVLVQAAVRAGWPKPGPNQIGAS